MNLLQSGERSPGLTIHGSWLVVQMIHRSIPVWFALAAACVLAGWSWRQQTAAPAFDTLLLLVSSCCFLSGSLLAADWPQLVGTLRTAGRLPIGQAVPMLLAAPVLSALALSTAPCGLLLAYSPESVWLKLSPLDIPPFELSQFDLLLSLLPSSGTLFMLVSMLMLLLCRAVAGHNAGSVLWLSCGLLLHSGAPDFVTQQPLCFASYAAFHLNQLTNGDLLQSDQIFGPLRSWQMLLWCIVLTGLAFSTALPREARRPAYSLAVIAAAVAAAAAMLRSWQSAQQWLANPARLHPEDLSGLAACVFAVGLATYTILEQSRRPLQLPLANTVLPLAACCCVLPLAALPLLQQGSGGLLDLGLLLASLLLLLALWAGFASTLQSLAEWACGRQMSSRWAAGLRLFVAACLLQLLLPVQEAGAAESRSILQLVLDAAQEPSLQASAASIAASALLAAVALGLLPHWRHPRGQVKAALSTRR